MRCGDFLAAAESKLRAIGGYRAEVDIDKAEVILFHIEPGTQRRVIHGTGPAPAHVAIEDAASKLLKELAPVLDPVKLAFTEDYFVVGFAPDRK